MEAHLAVRCRRRWARWGGALADFILSFVLTAAGHLLRGLAAAGRGVAGLWRRLRGRRRGIPAPRGAATSDPAGPPEGTRDFAPLVEKPDVRFEDIAGLEEAKREIWLRMIHPVLHPEQAERFRIRRGGGLLLWGPPGTGKTMLAKAVAAQIEAPFFHVRPSDLISGVVGEAEANVQRLFDHLRSRPRAVLFLDEVEALVPSRRTNTSTIMRRVVAQMLGEVDGVDSRREGHCLLVIGATNEPSLLDPAMRRPGRFDAQVYVGPPDRAARLKILRDHLAGRPVAGDVDLEALAGATEGMTGAELKGLVERAADEAFLASLRPGGEGRLIGRADLEGALEAVRGGKKRPPGPEGPGSSSASGAPP